MDKYPLIRKCLVIEIILLFVGASGILGMSTSVNTGKMPQTTQRKIQAIQKDVIGQSCLGSNALISNNTGNDFHPRMTTNSLGHTIVVYEQEIDSYNKNVAVVYSADDGEIWTEQLLFDSDYFTSGSGILEYPDIVYNAPNDLLYLTMIDPDAEMYNNEMCFIPGDIANCVPQEVKDKWYGVSACGDDYVGNAATTTDNFFLSMTIRNGTLDRYLEIFYVTYPDYETPYGIGGVYPDYGSVHITNPASNIEMDAGNRIYVVAESGVEEGPKITVKSATADEELLSSGVQQNGMDKYPDVEQWPGEYVAIGTDPDVSAFGNKVFIVYTQNGTVKCSYSTADKGYEPQFNWNVSTIDSGASAPAIYAQGNAVYCAYVKGGNLYMKTSEDGGVTWGAAEQKNDVDGTVVAEKGAIDICRSGIAFTDNRNGNYDIYFSSITVAPAPVIVIDSIAGGVGVRAVIRNIGVVPAEYCRWSIKTEGLVFVGKETSGIATLQPGASTTIKTGFMLGFGPIAITVIADTAKKTADAQLFLFFVKGL